MSVTRETDRIDLKLKQEDGESPCEFFVDDKLYGDVDYYTILFRESFDEWVEVVREQKVQLSPFANIEIKFRVNLHMEQLTGELKEMVRKIIPFTMERVESGQVGIIDMASDKREISAIKDKIFELQKELHQLENK